MQIPLDEIWRAREMLGRHFRPSRLIDAGSLRRGGNRAVYLKLESELPTGSFKPRGALYALHRKQEESPVHEVVASSTGNHGAAVAYAAKLLGISASIFLPRNSNPIKRERIAKLGAAIHETGDDIVAAFHAASDYAISRNAYFLNDATDPVLPAGPATIGCEILEQAPDTEYIYVPMGDTALIRGIASATRQLRSTIKIVGVQAEHAPSYFLSWKHRRVVSTPTCNTIADGLATRTPNAANVADVIALVDEVRLISDEALLASIRHLVLQEHVVAEPAGAASTAAYLEEKEPAGTAVLVVSGANISEEVLRAAIQKKY